MAYVLGFFAADGNMIKTKRKTHFIAIQLTDKEIVYAIRKTMNADHTISRRTRSSSERDIYRLQIGSKEMYEDLLKLGFSQNKTKRLLVPDMPKKYFFDFVRGYFDGDGNVWVGEVHKERKTRTLVIQIAFTSVSKDFLISLKNKLHEHGVIGGSIYSHKTKNYSRLAFVNSDALKISKKYFEFCIDIVITS